MIKTSVLLLTLGTVLGVAAPDTAAARDYPYCLQGRQSGYPGNCQFTSFQQCRATASGTQEDCGLNPVVAFGAQRDQPRPARRHRHRH